MKKVKPVGVGLLGVLGRGVLLSLLLWAIPFEALATFEFSLGFSFSRQNYSSVAGGDNYTSNRRWGTSIGYYFTELTEIEFGYQEVTDRTKITGYEDTTFFDRIYSVNWVQSFMRKTSALQPYVKVGVGQLNRDASGTYSNGLSPNPQIDSLTGILGVGMRIYLTRAFAIRVEGVSYLTGGNIQTFKDNYSTTIGASLGY